MPLPHKNKVCPNWYTQIYYLRTVINSSESRSVVSRPFATSWTARLLCPRDFPGKNTEVGSHFLLQVIFPTQGSNPGSLHCRQILYRLSHQGSSITQEWLSNLVLPLIKHKLSEHFDCNIIISNFAETRAIINLVEHIIYSFHISLF